MIWLQVVQKWRKSCWRKPKSWLSGFNGNDAKCNHTSNFNEKDIESLTYSIKLKCLNADKDHEIEYKLTCCPGYRIEDYLQNLKSSHREEMLKQSWCSTLTGWRRPIQTGTRRPVLELCKFFVSLFRSARTSCRTFDFPVPSTRPQQFFMSS